MTEIQRKRKLIEKILERDGDLLDPHFISMIRFQFQSDKNLDLILQDLDDFTRSEESLQRVHMEWNSVRIRSWNQPLKMDLTFRYEPLNLDETQDQYRIFIYQISKKIYRKAFKRYKRSIPNHSYVEGGSNKVRTHIHGTIETPEFIGVQPMIRIIHQYWWNYGSVRVQEIRSGEIDNLTGYNTKLRTKPLIEGSRITDSFITT